MMPSGAAKPRFPQDVSFQTKPQIALDQIRDAKAKGVAPGVVLTDAGYGADGTFRAGVSALDLTYIVGVQPTLSVWRPGEEPLRPKPWSGKGRPPVPATPATTVTNRCPSGAGRTASASGVAGPSSGAKGQTST